MDTRLYRGDIQEKIKNIRGLIGKNPNEVIRICKELLVYGEERRDDALLGFAHFTMGEIYYMTNDIANFYLEMDRCKLHLERIMEWGYVAASYNLQGIVAMNRGNIPLSMEQYFKGYDICEEKKFPDLKCIISINIAQLYYHYRFLAEASKYYDRAYKYIQNNMGAEGYVEKLAASIIGQGKIYLLDNDLDNAAEKLQELEIKCLNFLDDKGALAYNCLVARLENEKGNMQTCLEYVNKISEYNLKEITVMDVFEDIYEVLSMLLDIMEYNLFIKIYEKFFVPVKATLVKNLEKNLLRLRLRYLKENEMEDEYRLLAVKYMDLLEEMEIEISLTTSAIIDLRNELKRKKDELQKEIQGSINHRKRAYTDPLTGLFNRIKLSEYAKQSFDRAITNHIAFAIEMFDVDYFKEYNDNYGHQAGDECLIFIAKTLSSIAREHPGVSCYRYGGDEFVVMYQNFTEEEVFAIAKEIKNAVLAGGIKHEFSKSEEKVVTISQGIFWGIPEDFDSVWEYLKGADDHLYQVKKKKRNSIQLGKAKHESKKTQDSLEPLITEPKEE